MLKKLIIFIGILCVAIVGWILGFIRFPYLEQKTYFVQGFILCFAIVVLILFAIRIAKQHANRNTNAKPPVHILWPLLLLMITSASVIYIVVLYRQNNSMKTQISETHKKILELSEVVETSGSGNLALYMHNVLNTVEVELKANLNGVLSDTTIDKIATLSYTFIPRRYFIGDSLSENKISPERGQLLLALLMMDMDSISFAHIKSKVTFAGAGLNGAKLHGVDLSNADLKDANLKDANLSGANLSNADLSDAILFAANLDSAILISINLKRADLRWIKCNHADLSLADMNGAHLENAQFMHANLYKAKMQYANVNGAIFHLANMYGVDLMGSSVIKTNFTDADMHLTNLRMVKPDEAIFINTALHKAIVDSTWMDKMEIWQIVGKEEIENAYYLVPDTLDQWNSPLFRLVEKK